MAVGNRPSPAISIIIPCLGHARELRLCLEALQHQDAPMVFEVIVVDSGSDPQVEAATREHPAVRLIRSDESLSAGAARNAGAKAATAPTLAFIDADCVPDVGWVRAAIAAVGSGAVLASGPILDVHPWHLIASSDNRLQFVDFPAGRPPGLFEYCPGAHLVVSREAFDSQAGFAASVPHAQDVLFTAGIAKRWPERARFTPDLIVRHHGRANWRAYLAHQRAFGMSRAQYRVRMNSTLVWLSRHAVLGSIVVLRRLLYLSARVLQWNALDLPRFVLQLPVIVVGLAAWVQGFYSGVRRPGEERA